MGFRVRLRGRALLAAGGLGAYIAARRLASAPPDPDVEARADAAAHSGPWRHNFAVVNGLRLHYAEIGSGPLVVLLHGYPESWYMWHNILPRLGAHFHVVAPDMRGYNWSDKPLGVGAYRVGEVAGDIVALIEALGEESASIVAHDWGGLVAWELGMRHPDRLSKLVVINAPHPAVYARETRNPVQLLRSAYVLFFQLPVISEAVSRLMVKYSLRGSSAVPGAFSEEALDIYQNGIAQPGAATAMLNYYRAGFRNARGMFFGDFPIVHTPTMLIWGMKDMALGPGLIEGTEEWVPGLRVERVEESGHWVPEEKPRLVADLLIDFLHGNAKPNQ